MISLLKKLFTTEETKAVPKYYHQTLDTFQKEIDYTFKNKELLIVALKHSSFLQLTSEHKSLTNERMEFLGDAVLQLIVSDFLYEKYSNELEGELTKFRSKIVSRKSLAELGKQIQLGKVLLMSENEAAAGGRERDSIISNAYESLIGGIYLDGGFEEAKKFIHRFVLLNHEEIISDESSVNYKGKLLEFIQTQNNRTLQYVLEKEEGPDHDKVFTLLLKIDNEIYGVGIGKTKKIAEQIAASQGLKRLLEEEKK
ncbi:ribonuclease III [bacterium]|nr:ribonuclease III [bacterium]